ncbi:MAG: quinolinate synthase NadA [Bacteroidetes bacterium]|nr:quinolinate synthase NadA [Bacteroidota bacterium]
MTDKELIEQIARVKKEKNAVILAHYYQVPEIQDIADYVGDSLQLSQLAAATNADIIVFAGVHFMAETAKILSPGKKVLLPDLEAGCSLASSAPAGQFAAFVNAHPDHKVVTYINCTAEVKALSDVIVTSSNALKIVESFPKEQKLIFAPDKNLGAYINGKTGRDMLLWDGACEVHETISTKRIINLKMQNPDALLVAHPECKAPVLIMADFIGSTAAMLKFTQQSDSKKFIVATETGIIHQMEKLSPGKEFLVVPADETCACNDCPYMKLNTLEKLYLCMVHEKPEIILSAELIEKAKLPIMKMLELSKNL